MNSENFRSLGCVEPPTSTDDNSVPTNSFSVNQYGDVALLRKDGKVVFSTLSGDDKHIVYEKPIDHEELLISNKFTGIEFSEDGTILMLWSEKVGYLIVYTKLRSIDYHLIPIFYCC
jgi:hypothetical protein